MISLKDQTRERYRGILRRELLPVFGPIPLAKIHPHQVRTSGRRPGGRAAVGQQRPPAHPGAAQLLKAALVDGHLDTLPLLA